MDQLEERLYRLEQKSERLFPSGLTAKSVWTRIGTVFLYNLILSSLFAIGYFIIVILFMIGS